MKEILYTAMVIWKLESLFQLPLQPCTQPCGFLGEAAISILCMYINQELHIHNIK